MDDSQFSGNSLKVNVKVNSVGGAELNGKSDSIKKEIYKAISEDNLLPPINKDQTSVDNGVSTKSIENQLDNGESKMVQEETTVNDGADERMLGTEDNDKLAERREEVKFIKGDQQNGDAKIDIGNVNGKTFTGMTKEELMKYANDPFWVRLRWIFFIGFWAIWVAMLVGAVLIIIQAPKCSAPEPLPWYKQGPLAKFNSIEKSDNDLSAIKKLQATGVIYELPAELTYSVKEPAIEENIKNLVASYKDSNAHIILDITPNYVNKESLLMTQALADKTKRSAFVWMEQPEVPNNWLSIVNGSAWSEVQPGNYVLSQFGDGLFDLHMNDTLVKREFIDVLSHLLHLGIKGFRLKNTKFFLLTKNIRDEIPSNDPRFVHTQYGFWTHTQTTFQDGLGDLLYEYMVAVKNISAEALFSVADDVVRPEVYQNKDGDNGIELPIYGRFPQSLAAPQGKQLLTELKNTLAVVGNSSWLQWNYGDLSAESPVDPSAFGLFLALLPGVPVVPVSSTAYSSISNETYKHIEQLRSAASYKYGDFEVYQTSSDIAAYSRIKSGNPGYFVAFNPSDVTVKGNYTNLGLPDKMTVDVISENYNVTNVNVKTKVMANSIEISPYSTIILTYVPVKSG